MGIIRKYGFVLFLMLAVIYVYAPLSLEDVAKLWLIKLSQYHPQQIPRVHKREKWVLPQLTQSPQRMSTRTWTTESPNG